MAKTIKSKSDINKYFDDLRECTFKAIVDTLSYLGELCVRWAREDHPNNWDDHTGNLRSSIGYIVTYNGQDITPKSGIYTAFDESRGKPAHTEQVSFIANKGKANEKQVSFAVEVEAGTEGAKEGARFADSLKSQHPEGFALIVVAGMNYAEYVEATGRDVIRGAELKARDWWRKGQKRIPEKIEAEMKKRGW